MIQQTVRHPLWWEQFKNQLAWMAVRNRLDLNRDTDFEVCLELMLYNGKWN